MLPQRAAYHTPFSATRSDFLPCARTHRATQWAVSAVGWTGRQIRIKARHQPALPLDRFTDWVHHAAEQRLVPAPRRVLRGRKQQFCGRGTARQLA